MTKKHFIALADWLRNWNDTQFLSSLSQSFTNEQIQVLGDFCATQNPNFNRERWLAYIAGECGPNGGKR